MNSFKSIFLIFKSCFKKSSLYMYIRIENYTCMIFRVKKIYLILKSFFWYLQHFSVTIYPLYTILDRVYPLFSTANYKLVVINQGVGPVYFELDFNFVRRFPTHPPSPTFIWEFYTNESLIRIRITFTIGLTDVIFGTNKDTLRNRGNTKIKCFPQKIY